MLRQMTMPFRSPSSAWRALAAVASGLLLSSAFPPLEASAVAWIALVPLLVMARYSPPRTALRWGFVSGMVFWLTDLAWLLCLSRTGGPWPLVGAGWILLSAYCALYMAAFAMLVSALFELWMPAASLTDRIESGQPPPAVNTVSAALGQAGLVVVIPLLWVGLEYLRGTWFTGFPWNPVGVSQFRNLVLIQSAEWGGVYAVSAVVLVMNTVLAMTSLRLVGAFMKRRQTTVRVDLVVAVAIFSFYWIGGVKALRRVGLESSALPTVSLAAVQPNIPQLKKWPEEFAQEIYRRLKAETELAIMARPDLIIWPETAVPGPLTTDPEVGGFVTDLATNGVPLLVGALEEDVSSDRYGCLYNSSFLVDDHGAVVDVYRKLHLVPFGEYLPFDSQFTLIKRLAPLGFSCTPGTSTTVFHLAAPNVQFAVLICFEDIFAPLSRAAVRRGARFLINQTNDAWFDGTAGALQHLSQCVFRCVENRVGAVRAANTGITCFINRSGKADMLLNAAGEARFAGFKLDRVPVAASDMSLTFYTRYGDRPFALPCGVAVVLVFALVLIREKRRMRSIQA